jgi:transcriptional regulator GlxA family with amidase domain
MGDLAPGQDLQPVLNWALEHLDADVTVAALARRAHMSARTFARRFAAVTGTTPHKWLVAQRSALAERMLEETDHGVELVAQWSGFGSAAALRHHFSRRRGTSPRSYRQTFRDSS